MKIAVVGAGAIGGILAVRLAKSGQEVTAIDQGAQLAAIRSKGLTLIHPDGTEEAEYGLHAVGTCAEAGPQDMVFLSVKAYQVEALAPIAPRGRPAQGGRSNPEPDAPRAPVAPVRSEARSRS